MLAETKTKPIIYLACPYTHTDRKIREYRFNCATQAAAHLVAKGAVVYSPITMTHPIDLVLAAEGETLGSDFWVSFDESFMNVCSKIIVLKIDGWEESSGIKREVSWFKSHDRSVEFLEWTEVSRP